jgi:hypothetical protein
MKGVIFKHFEAFVVENFGVEVFETILDRTPLRTSGPFLGPGTYPDEDLFALVGTALELSGLAAPDALFAFGRFLFPRLTASVPELLRTQRTTKELLLTLDRVIHVEVRKMLPEAETPRILCRDDGSNSLDLTYRSSRKLCHLMRGLIDAAAEHYGERVEMQETCCMHDGADSCAFRMTFIARERAAA